MPRRHSSRSSSRKRSRSHYNDEDRRDRHRVHTDDAIDMVDSEELNRMEAAVLRAELSGNASEGAALREKIDALKRASSTSAEGNSSGKRDISQEFSRRRHDSGKGLERKVELLPSVNALGGLTKASVVERKLPSGLIDGKDVVDVFKEKIESVDDADRESSRLVMRMAHLQDLFGDDAEEAVLDRDGNKRHQGKHEERSHRRERERAIEDSLRLQRALEKCRYCVNSRRFDNELLVSTGETVALMLPQKELVPGHSILVPMEHTSTCSELEENVAMEMGAFRKYLRSLYATRKKTVVFLETAMHLKRQGHAVVDVIPIPERRTDDIPMFFREAMENAETEWAQHRKIIVTTGRGINQSIPPGFPYVHASFFRESEEHGLAHVIEDERKFPSYFMMEIVGGLLELEAIWLRSSTETEESRRRRVLGFKQAWLSTIG